MRKKIYISALFALIAAFCIAPDALAQAGFNNAAVEYTFELPDAKWKMTTRPSATSPNVEYVYRDRTEGHLEVRKHAMAPHSSLADVVREEEQRLEFLPGYVAGKQDPFGGFLKGVAYNFEFVRGGRPMSGRFYFLQADAGSVYVLRFTGFRDNLRNIRNQTDSIARTFNVKKN